MTTTRWQYVLCLGKENGVGTQFPCLGGERRGVGTQVPCHLFHDALPIPSPVNRQTPVKTLPSPNLVCGRQWQIYVYFAFLFIYEKVNCAHEQTDVKDVSDRLQSVPFVCKHSRFTYCRSCLVPEYWNFVDNIFFHAQGVMKFSRKKSLIFMICH